MIKRLLVIPLSALTAGTWAGDADVLDVELSCHNETECRVSVTVQHEDEGWDHYADLWEVLGPDGEVLGERILAHPHEHEQPFTRSLSGVVIPPHVGTITVRARDSVHGFGGREMTVEVVR